jgi:hypothetical protein
MRRDLYSGGYSVMSLKSPFFLLTYSKEQNRPLEDGLADQEIYRL